jgi:hypothetical protein
MNTYLRKQLVLALLLFALAPAAEAQLSTFGEMSVSGGIAPCPAIGTYLGGAAHGMAGIQYGWFAFNLGGGVIRLPAGYGNERRQLINTIWIDFPAGLALRIPVFRQDLLVVGSDFSGFIGRWQPVFQPHIGLLFPGRWQYRGVFLKAVLAPTLADPVYIGIGLKMVIRT